MPSFRSLPLLGLLFAGLLLGGCGGGGDDGGPGVGGTTAVPAELCGPERLETFKTGVLTVGTDGSTSSPYFENGDPTNGKGFESAVAYAVADGLGFNRSSVEWVTVPFTAAVRPGPKEFDFFIGQVPISPRLQKAVDFSAPYYAASQGVLVTKGSDLMNITRLDELKDATLGVQAGAKGVDAVEGGIDPVSAPKVFDTLDDLVSALKQGQVDAIVVDLPAAIRLRDAAIPGSTVVGQFGSPGGEEWGALLAGDSPMTDCVDLALENMKDDGTLEEITRQWMSEAAGAPHLD